MQEEMIENLRVLVVEDEEGLNEILQFNLESEGYLVDTSFSAEEALQRDLSQYNLIVLDVMMGKMSGFTLAQKIRKEMHLETPVIFLTARDSENDLLTGFNLGADDYITKPFSIKELLARAKAVIKRTAQSGPTSEEKLMPVGGITIDPIQKRVLLHDRKIDLTRKEYDILILLARSPGRIFSREEILNRIWEDDVVVTERTVDVNMTRLRRKLEECGSCIRNKAGFGYYFEI